jgi:hypothetical protein
MLSFSPAPTVQNLPDRVVVENAAVTLSISRATGRFDIAWAGEAAIRGAYGEARLPDGRLRDTFDFARHTVATHRVHDPLGDGVEVTVRDADPDGPELRQTFWIYSTKPEAFVRLDLLDRQGRGTNLLTPLVSDGGVQLSHDGPLQNLFVPYDNDNYFRFNSQGWKDASYEVGALYDDASRRGLVVG